MNKIEDMVAQAIGDPGSMVPRAGDDETVTRWATRAVLEVLEVGIIGLGNSADLPETPAMRALVENVALRDRLWVAEQLLADYVDDEPCRLDHHGHCQDHGGSGGDGVECRNARARRVLGLGSVGGGAWFGPDEGDIKPPPPPIDAASTDLQDMIRAVGFGAYLLRTELGPGGLIERESEALRANWSLAIDCLEAAATVPMIPLFFWRERKAREVPAPPRVGLATLTLAVPSDRSGCEGVR